MLQVVSSEKNSGIEISKSGSRNSLVNKDRDNGY